MLLIKTRPAVIILLLSVLTATSELFAQQPSATDPSANADTAEASKHFKYFGSLAHAFSAKLASGEELKVVSEPLLNWTIGSSWHGSFFIWNCKDRPVLVGCFLTDSQSTSTRRSFIEMHTLVDEPFTPIAIKGSREFRWEPSSTSKSVLDLRTLPTPAANSQQKRRQMRAIAESFTVFMYADKKDGDGTEQLRMLSTPLYRYPESANGAVSGAIYAFVRTSGTDPEFLLAIEHDPKKKETGWHVRPIRFASRRLELHHQQSIVWKSNEYDFGATNLTEPYMIVTLLESSTEEYNAVRDHMIQRVDSQTAR